MNTWKRHGLGDNIIFPKAQHLQTSADLLISFFLSGALGIRWKQSCASGNHVSWTPSGRRFPFFVYFYLHRLLIGDLYAKFNVTKRSG